MKPLLKTRLRARTSPFLNALKKVPASFGTPSKKEYLTKELSGCRSFDLGAATSWLKTSSSLSPRTLENILEGLNTGNSAAEYLTLAMEMEERDPHYASVLATRKHAVGALAPKISLLDTTHPKGQEALRDVQKIIQTSSFSFLLYDLLDALGKGYSVVEIIWQLKEEKLFPKEFLHRDPRRFRYDTKTQRSLELLSSDGLESYPLLPFKYILHQSRLKSGSPLQSGLARLLATSYMLKSYTLNAWASFIDVAGLPMRLGKYDSTATAEDIEQLKKAVSYLGTDTGAVIPEAMQIEFISNTNAQGLKDLFIQLAKYLDEQTSKAVLGQTLTTDSGSSYAQAQVHNEIRKSIVQSDAHLLSHTLQRDLIDAFLAINFGPQAPRISLSFEDQPVSATREQLISAAKELTALGIKIPPQDLLKKLGL